MNFQLLDSWPAPEEADSDAGKGHTGGNDFESSDWLARRCVLLIPTDFQMQNASGKILLRNSSQ